MRKLLWTLGIVLGGGLAAYLAFQKFGGRPPGEAVPVPDLSLPDVSLPDWSLPFGNDGDDPMTVYKWQDDAGAWHFSDRAPEGRASEAIEVQPQNVTPDPAPAPAEKAPPEAAGDGPLTGLVGRARDAARAVEAQGAAVRERLDAGEGP